MIWTDRCPGANIFDIHKALSILNIYLMRRYLILVFAAAVLLSVLSVDVRAQGDGESIDAVAIFNQGQDLHEKNNLTGAINRYREALRVLPEFPEAEYQLGIAQLALGRTDEAEQAFRRAVELRPDWSLAMNGLASVLLLSESKDNLDEARSILEKILETDERNPPALASLAELSVKTHASPDELKALLDRITPLTVTANPTAAIWTARAGIELSLGRTEAAQTSLAAALAIDPTYRNAILASADIAIAAGDLNKARALAKTLEKGRAGSDSAVLLNANILAAEGKFDDALKIIETLKSPSAASIALKNRILSYRSTTAAEVEKLLAGDPNNGSILGRLCVIYRRDDPPKAVEYCRRAYEIEPKNINHALGFGAALVQARQFEQAVNVLRSVVAAAPDNATAHANLGTALFQLKRYAEAKAEFRWLADAQPSAPTPYFFLGVIHDHLGEYAEAVANYQQYLKVSDPVADRLDIDRVNLRMPALQKFVRKAAGKRN